MPLLAFLLYNIVLLLLSPVLVFGILFRLFAGKETWSGLPERLGLIPRNKLPGGPRVWVHAVSVGETVASRPIETAVQAALPGYHLLHSSTTLAGQAHAAKLIGDTGQVVAFPFDLLPCVWLALLCARPALVVVMETELWPNFLTVARWLGCKVMVANGIVSDRSLQGAARLGPLYRWTTAQVDAFCMQAPEFCERISTLGADPTRVSVAGNSKFDQADISVSLGEQMTLRSAMDLSRDEPVLLAGSTHPGEEEVVLQAFRLARNDAPTARLVIAPRHLHRVQDVEQLIVAHGFAAARRSKIGTAPTPPDAVIILDTIGELARAYALCTAAFVGGSFVPVGGHNILEPMGLGKAAIFGPHMHKQRDLAAIALEAKVGFQTENAEDLAAIWLEFLTSPALCRDIATRALGVMAVHRGASARIAATAASLVGGIHHPVPRG